MDFDANKTPIEVIKEGAFGGISFGYIYSGVNEKGYKKSWRESILIKKYYCSNYYDVSVKWYGARCGASLRSWENKRWINEIDPYGWFQWYSRYWLGRRSEDDERQINKWRKIVSRFKCKLVKMIKDSGSKFDDYSISPKVRQISMYWDYELTEKGFFINSTS